MLSKTLASAAVAASLILAPATRATADSKDFIAGALLGGVAGAIIQKEVRKKKALQLQQQQQLRARTRAPQATYAPKPRKYSPRKAYRPSIPVTTEGKDIQSALTYFGFNVGTVDGRVGPKTRAAVSDYQRYMGYEGTGTLTSFQRHLLTSSYLRAEAGGSTTLGQIAALPDGTRGLLKLYREDLASGTAQRRTLTPAPSVAYTDL